MINKEKPIFIIMSLTLSGLIFLTLTLIKYQDILLYTPYLVSGGVSFALILVTFILSKKVLYKGNQRFFLYSIWAL
ncbi:MAG TPA: hypothetical protein ENI73_00030 [Spirochaetes bacterium]|nr:hypothetical protein [Spirochaetota bacterium]